MKLITFPKKEWNDVKSRLDNDKIVNTIRVGNEYGKFNVGDIAKTEWGLEIKIISVKKISGGVDGLKNEYKYFSELTKDMIKEISDYDDMEIITLSSSSLSSEGRCRGLPRRRGVLNYEL